MRSSRTWLPLVVGAIALVAVACGTVASSAPAGTPANTATSPTPTAITDGLYVTDAWVRPPMGPDRPAAGYLTITNTSWTGRCPDRRFQPDRDLGGDPRDDGR